MHGALFFTHQQEGALAEEVRPSRPVGVLFLTSLRNSFFAEFNGQTILVNGKLQYMEGVIERTISETRPGGMLCGLVEVKGVVVDDTPLDVGKEGFSLVPKNESPWIYPVELGIPVWNFPTKFRKLPISDIEGRKVAKLDFETSVLEKAIEIGADVIISDGYMARIDFLQTTLGMYGKILNIHPGPAMEGMTYCFRGKDEIMDAIRFAQTNGGYAKTGATLHFVNGEIDEGNAVAYVCETPVSSEDTETELMFRNYQQAKLPLFIGGLQHYMLNIFPHL